MWNKIIGPTVLVVMFWLAFAGLVAIVMWWIGQFHARVVAETGITIQAANSMTDNLWKRLSYILAAKPANLPKIEEEVASFEKQFEQQLVLAEQTSYTATEQEISRVIRRQHADLQGELHKRLASIGRPTAETRVSDPQLLAAAREIDRLCTELREFNEHLAAADEAQQGRYVTFIALAFLGILLLGTVGGVLWSVHTAAEVDTSVSEISISLEGADRQMKQELGHIDLNVSGNLDRLREQVDVVTDRIRQVVGDLQQERRKSIVASRVAVAGELAAGVAHEIRNPLTAIKLLLHAAEQHTANRSLSERQFDVIQDEIARMEKIVQGLLDFARPPQVNRVRHDLRATVGSAIELLSGLADSRGVVVCRTFPERPVNVDADPEQLRQVFVNLLLNAVEAMPTGGTLRVGIEMRGAAEMGCRVAVADSGPGIPPQLVDRLFEPFVSGKQYGTGLGLAVSRRLVHEQGGQLTAANAPTGGAVLTLELPLADTVGASRA
jgi:signal transduction histidine kinase